MCWLPLLFSYSYYIHYCWSVFHSFSLFQGEPQQPAALVAANETFSASIIAVDFLNSIRYAREKIPAINHIIFSFLRQFDISFIAKLIPMRVPFAIKFRRNYRSNETSKFGPICGWIRSSSLSLKSEASNCHGPIGALIVQCSFRDAQRDGKQQTRSLFIHFHAWTN